MSEHATALERLYRTQFGAFVRTVTAHLGDAEAARDVVQEGFAVGLARLDSYRGEGPLEAWMWRIVINKATDRLREGRASERKPIFADAEAYEANGSVEDRRIVRARLAALPERQRLAVFLHYYADLDYATIANVLQIAPGTVAATLNAARTSLRERLREEGQ